MDLAVIARGPLAGTAHRRQPTRTAPRDSVAPARHELAPPTAQDLHRLCHPPSNAGTQILAQKLLARKAEGLREEVVQFERAG